MIIVFISRHLRFISLLLIISFIDFGCASTSKLENLYYSGTVYKYIYEMTEPSISKDMMYKDPKFNIWFNIDQGAITYTIRNTSTSKISVLNGNALFGINGEFFPVRTSASYYTDSVSYLSTNIVPSTGLVQDFIIPRNSIFYDGNKWVEKVLFATRDCGDPVIKQSIGKNIGSEVALVLPIKVGTEENEYTFKFKITRITSARVVKSDSVLLAGIRLPPPMPKRSLTKTEMWTSIGIVSSVILFSIFLVTRDKTFPGGL